MTAVNCKISIESRSNTSVYLVRRSLLIRLPSPLSRSGSTPPHRTCFAPVATMAASRASSTRQVQSDWHVLPDGTKLEVLKQTCDPVRHLPCDSLHMQSFVLGFFTLYYYPGGWLDQPASADAAWGGSCSLVLQGRCGQHASSDLTG